MGTNTPRLNLFKPAPSDLVDVTADISANYDLIDAGTALVGHAHSGTYVHPPALFVAASDATAKARAAADYVCDGTADEVEINAAIAALSAGGGVVQLSEGHFWLQAPVVSDIDYITLLGSGYGTVLQQQNGSTSLTAHVILGNTRNVSRNVLSSLRLYGRRDGSPAPATGHGVITRGSNLVLRDLWVNQIPQDGVSMSSFDATSRFESLLDNVYVQSAGNDGIVLDQYVSNTELVRCMVVGGQVPNANNMTLQAGAFGRYGFNVAGPQSKFVVCHAYFCTWGFFGTSNVQIIGGEYETNQTGGIHVDSCNSGRIIGAILYDNLGTAIELGSNAHWVQVADNWIGQSNRSGLATYGIRLTHAYRCAVHANVISQIASGGHGIRIDSTSDHNEIYGNQITPMGLSPTGNGGEAIYLYDAATFQHIHHNMVEGKITENFGGTGSPSSNIIESNWITFGGAFAGVGGSNSRLRRNQITNTPSQETSGTATVASGTTSIQVTHNAKGLSGAPQVINVTATNGLGSATKFWITGATSTVFTITVNVDPGAGGATFQWAVQAWL